MADKNNKSIEWIPLDDGYEGYNVVGYSWYCPECDNFEVSGKYFLDEITCPECGSVFKNLNKPE